MNTLTCQKFIFEIFQIYLFFSPFRLYQSHLIIFSFTDSSFLFYGVFQPIKLRPEYPCSLMSIPRDYRKIGNGLLFQKQWPYTKLINYHLLKV